MKPITPEYMAKVERIAYLLKRLLRNEITIEEKNELDEWIGTDPGRLKLSKDKHLKKCVNLLN